MIGDGVETYADSTLQSTKKDVLIDFIRVLESNLRNSHEANNIQYHNCLKLLKEERTKTIEEFAEWIFGFTDGYYFSSKEEIINAFINKNK